MEGQRFRLFLHTIADQLRAVDLENMKYLCSDRIEAGECDRAKSARDFFVLLQNRQLIQPSDISFLLNLLKECDRKDLVKQARSCEGDVVPESGVPASETGSSPDGRKYRFFMSHLSDELTAKDIESFKFLIDIPAGMSPTMTSGLKIFDYLQRSGQIGPSDISLLAQIFDQIHRKDLAKRVQTFGNDKPKVSVKIPERIHTQPQRTPRQPSTHSEHQPGASPRLPLLTPEHFQPRVPDFIQPIVTIPTVPEYHDEEDIMPAYGMDKRPRGIALIFSNKNFSGNVDLAERLGTEKDIENLRCLWEKLHFNVIVKEDLTAHEMYDTARDFSRLDHSQYDCFVCCILSHGVQGSIYGSDGDLIEIGQITSQFKGTACHSLNNKPKLFFVQACRGRDFDVGTQPDAVRNSDEEAMRHSAEPNEGHFLLGYATPPGYVSWRSTEHGSWYISHLCTIFADLCERYDVMSMMVKVNDKVSDAYTKKGYKQCPAPVVTLRKRIYFNKN